MRNSFINTSIIKEISIKTGGIKAKKSSTEKLDVNEENVKKIIQSLNYSLKENLKMHDRKLTETFIEDFMLIVAKVILIVVPLYSF